MQSNPNIKLLIGCAVAASFTSLGISLHVWYNQTPRGPQGPRGYPGPQGHPGHQGHTGPSGETGPRGLDGVQGPRGLDGVQGPRGLDGVQEPRGLEGVQGCLYKSGGIGVALTIETPPANEEIRSVALMVPSHRNRTLPKQNKTKDVFHPSR